MIKDRVYKRYFFWSLFLHGFLLLAIIISIEFYDKPAVFENSHQSDVISAVVLGDTERIKVIQKPAPVPAAIAHKPIKEPTLTPPVRVKETVTKIAPPKSKMSPNINSPAKVKPIKNEPAKKQAVKIIEKKLDVIPLEKPKLLPAVNPDDIAQSLLKDLKKEKAKQKKIKEAELKKQFEKTLQQSASQSLREKLLDDSIHTKAAVSRLSSGEVNKYKALIVQSISEHWLVPSGSNKKSASELLIRLAPGGAVLEVRITRSSGDPLLDRSAKAAVLKASPLPVPKDTNEFDSFREFVLKVKPENIIDNG